jgi:hypothetical protein
VASAFGLLPASDGTEVPASAFGLQPGPLAPPRIQKIHVAGKEEKEGGKTAKKKLKMNTAIPANQMAACQSHGSPPGKTGDKQTCTIHPHEPQCRRR